MGRSLTDKVNEMWGTDMTQTITMREGRANVFVAVNTPTRKLSASMQRGRLIASRPWSRCARESIAASEPSHPVWRVD